MKRIFSIVLAFFLCLSLTATVRAAQAPRLLDAADLLDDHEEAELLAVLDGEKEEA